MLFELDNLESQHRNIQTTQSSKPLNILDVLVLQRTHPDRHWVNSIERIQNQIADSIADSVVLSAFHFVEMIFRPLI